jgi:hypothetical protein
MGQAGSTVKSMDVLYNAGSTVKSKGGGCLDKGEDGPFKKDGKTH